MNLEHLGNGDLIFPPQVDLAMSVSDFRGRLQQARAGDRVVLGQLLDAHRNYLLAIANAELVPELGPKAGGSDLVQQTFGEATVAIQQFDGNEEAELLAWLRTILLNNIADFNKRFMGTTLRDIRRERPNSDSRTLTKLPAPVETPSAQVANREEQEHLDLALNQLNADQRCVIELRCRDKLKFSEIAQRMNRSEDAARMLWQRAIVKLQQILAKSGTQSDGFAETERE